MGSSLIHHAFKIISAHQRLTNTRLTVLISGQQREVWHLNMICDGTESVKGSTGWYLVVLGQYGAELVHTWWYWESIGRNWLISNSTGSVWSITGWFMMLLGQYGAVLVSTWWCWVSRTWYCLELGGTGLIWGLNACIYWKKWRLGRVSPHHSRTNEPTNKQTGKDRGTQPLEHGRLRWAILLRAAL